VAHLLSGRLLDRLSREEVNVELLQPVLMIVGLLGWFISKNKRWAILSLIGLAWFVIDIAVLVSRQLP
jgi:hypothetical protein